MKAKLFNKIKIAIMAGLVVLMAFITTKTAIKESLANCGCKGGGGGTSASGSSGSGGSGSGGSASGSSSYNGPPITGTGPQTFANAWVAACGKNNDCANQCPAAMTIAAGESTFRATVTGKGGAIGGWQIDPSNGNYSAMQSAGSNLVEQANIVQRMTDTGQDWSLWATCTTQGADVADQVRSKWNTIGGYTDVCNNAYSKYKLIGAKPNTKIPNGCSS